MEKLTSLGAHFIVIWLAVNSGGNLSIWYFNVLHSIEKQDFYGIQISKIDRW